MGSEREGGWVRAGGRAGGGGGTSIPKRELELTKMSMLMREEQTNPRHLSVSRSSVPCEQLSSSPPSRLAD